MAFLRKTCASEKYTFDVIYSAFQKLMRRNDVSRCLELAKEFKQYPNALKGRLLYNVAEDICDINLLIDIYNTEPDLNELIKFVPVCCNHVKCLEGLYAFRIACEKELNFDEFEENINQVLFVSATPGPYEIEHSTTVAEQIIRPTGLLDPIIEVRPIENQIDNLVGEINKVVEKNERVLITTLTKKMSEDLTNYLKEIGMKVKYLHSDIDTLERTEIIRDLRLGKFDVLVGINLLREGLDIPEVSLVAILDADKEGFLRSETSLIQTVGRAARNAEGRVIMYADKITRSMAATIEETKRRREIQSKYNEENGIVPKTIVKEVRDSIETLKPADEEVVFGIAESEDEYEVQNNIETLQKEMMEAAQNLQFERAAQLRDKIKELEERIK